MNTKTQLSVHQQLVSIRSQVKNNVAQLLSEHPSARCALLKTNAIGHLIDSLPFATDQYALAKNRLPHNPNHKQGTTRIDWSLADASGYENAERDGLASVRSRAIAVDHSPEEQLVGSETYAFLIKRRR